MNSEKQLIIYKASAGSGKTYTISQEFIKLLSSENISYSDILAVTFTNKAAFEMKKRIIDQIRKNAEANPLSKFNTILLDILNNYDEIEISTIDSFLQKIITHLYDEGYLKGENKLTLETNPFIDFAIQKTIDQIGIDANLTKNILQNIEENISQGKSWKIESIMKQLFLSYLQQKPIEESNEIIETASNEINLTISKLKSDIKTKTSKILEILKNNNLSIADFAYGSTGVMAFIEKLNRGEISPLGSRAKIALLDAEKWVSKTSDKKKIIIQLVKNEILPHFETVAKLIETNYQNYTSATIAKKYIFLATIVEKINQNLNIIKKNQNATFLEDNLLYIDQISNTLNEKSLQALFPKKFKSIFIDEFQDLSIQQWNFFKEIIKDTIQDNTNILVGDPKQSIYRWRGGDWSIMQNKISEEFADSTTKILDTNWRSAKEITLFNNTFFFLAPQIIAEKLHLEAEEISDNILKYDIRKKIDQAIDVYQHHEQKPKPESSNPKGYIEIEYISEEEQTENEEENESSRDIWMKICTEKLIKTVEEAQDDGFQLNDIAIIVRNNSEARYLIDAFLKKSQKKSQESNYSYKITSKIATVLGENEAIIFIFSVIKYLKIAKDNILFTEIKYFLQYNYPSFNQSEIEKILQNLEKKKLTHYSELIITIIEHFNLYANFPQYIEALLEIIDSKKEDFHNFHNLIEWWNKYGQYTTLSGENNTNSITIYTIHQSKGLQFPITIIPFCNWDLDHSHTKAPILWNKFSQNPTYIGLPIKYSKDLINTDFSKDYFYEKIETHLDNLNLMYVAFTRAIERLYIFLHKKNLETCNDTSSLINFTIEKKFDNNLNSDIFLSSLNQFLSEKGNTIKIGQKCAKTTKHFYASEKSSIIETNKNFHQNFSINQYIKPINKNSSEIDFGNHIHALLEKISTVEEIHTLHEKFLSLPTKSENDVRTITILELMTKNDFFIKYFNKTCYHIVEQPILSKEGEIFRPDRIILNNKEVLVVDFKTGEESNDHIKQLKKYIELVEKLEQKSPNGAIVYFKENNIQIKTLNYLK